ncbi:MAG TPA: glycosyltransferase, partial [Bacteroidales bacterium]|nr:glycosyltransferase [Bacteroidales bacterium]
VAPSQWMARHLGNSFLKNNEIKVIYNGIDTDNFRPINADSLKEKYEIKGKYILGVANIWNKRKGLDDLIKLSSMIQSELQIVLVGISRSKEGMLPDGIKSISRTENIDELAAIYSGADIFVNPTYADNFPTTNIEALACGTPVITYNTGGSPEAIDENTGIIVNRGDIEGLICTVKEVLKNGKNHYTHACRERAVRLYNKNDRFADYISIYRNLVERT